MLQRPSPPDRGRVLRAGDRGWLVEPPTPGEVSGLAATIREQDWASVVAEVVPAARTVLVTVVAEAHADAIGAELVRLVSEHRHGTNPTRSVRTVEIPVHYDGTDLEEVAASAGISVAEVARAHAEAEYTVGFFGFAPGFAYLDGVPDVLPDSGAEYVITHYPGHMFVFDDLVEAGGDRARQHHYPV